jgi:hypothetical protein
VTNGDRFDPARLFGCAVVSDSGRRLGRVIALIHRADGCDVLVERRHWLRHTALRLDLDDLAQIDRSTYRHRPGLYRLAGGPGDDRVA